MRKIILVLIAAFAIAGCGADTSIPVPDSVPVPDLEPALHRVPNEDWPLLVDDLDPDSLYKACDYSVSFFESLPADELIKIGAEERTAAQFASGLRRLREVVVNEPDPGARKQMLQQEFLLFRSVGRDGFGEVLFTGYFEPLMEARRRLEPPFEYPIFGMPDDLVTVDLEDFGFDSLSGSIVGRVESRQVRPYPDRAEIDFGLGLTGRAVVLGYLDDPLDVFFLHVQGSGTLVFPDGTSLRTGYASSNGRSYRSIGKLLIDDGLVSREEMSMQAIRDYLEKYPEEIPRVLAYNPSYIFFRPLAPEGGPLGCYDLPVTGGRSIATDRNFLPAPIMAYIQTSQPELRGDTKSISRFVLNQDTGSSIQGPGRVDLFFGLGDAAGEVAGLMKNSGTLYIFVPKLD